MADIQGYKGEFKWMRTN